MLMYSDIEDDMVIKTLEDMEVIVADNDNLVWEGWDVLWYKPYPAGFLKKDGAFFKGKWTLLKRISPTRKGWVLPKALLGGV